MISPKKYGGSVGLSLVELLVVLMIIGILAALLIPNISAIQVKAEGAVCNARLRNLWTAFSSQLNDGNGWPQLPPNIKVGSTEEQQWWLTTTSNSMGLTKRDWNCPTLARASGRDTNSQQSYLISYLPTLFDARPMTPSKWPRIPWFTEAVGMHGKGNLSVRADGSVCPVQDQ
jgi:prepilin-type N-terminal cleavage/methylation domain-containing protein